jgi:hypothetical protein
VVAYSATEIRKIATNYSALITGESLAAQKLIRANWAFQAARASIAEITILSSEVDSKRAVNDLETAQADITNSFDLAIAALPTEAGFGVLKAEALKVLES